MRLVIGPGLPSPIRIRSTDRIALISASAEELAASGQEQSASTEEIASSANRLAEAADKLTGAVKSFRLLADEEHPPAPEREAAD